MTRRVTPKDGAEAVAMLDREAGQAAFKGEVRSILAGNTTGAAAAERLTRRPRLHVDPATGATVLEPKRRAAKKPAAKPAPKKAPAKPARGESKAALVRALLDEGKTVKEVAVALKDKGITWSYAWDVAAAYEKKTGKVFIASHAKGGAA
jgi:hypothetical protein